MLRFFCIVGWDWFGLVLYSVCKKGKMLSFQRKCCQNFVKHPCSCFGYKLSYNNSNEVIPIGKEP